MKKLKLILLVGLTAGVLLLQQCKSSGSECMLEDPICNPLLTLLSSEPASSSHYLFSSGGDSLVMSTFAVNEDDGTLEEIDFSLVSSNTFSDMFVSPVGDSIYALGAGSSEIQRLDIDDTGTVTIAALFTGPDNILGGNISPAGDTLFINSFVDDSNAKISSYTIDADSGELTSAGEYSYTTLNSPNNTISQGIAVNSAGDRIYVPNYSNGNIQGLTVSDSGAFTDIPGTPFTSTETLGASLMHPGGKLLYSIASSTDGDNNRALYAYSVESNFGILTELSSTNLSTESNDSNAGEKMTFDASGKFLFVTVNKSSENLYVFAVDESSGALTPVTGSPYTAGSYPQALVMGPESQYLFVSSQTYGSTDTKNIEMTTGTKNSNASESDSGSELGEMISYRIEETGELTKVGTVYSSITNENSFLLMK